MKYDAIIGGVRVLKDLPQISHLNTAAGTAQLQTVLCGTCEGLSGYIMKLLVVLFLLVLLWGSMLVGGSQSRTI